ncbi:MAG: hypothetical protein IPL59_05885 [Candidatus Competibacteraceae bacterium]|nr:hypothetical protein [Candidatus Competibacteraceae bacterium]
MKMLYSVFNARHSISSLHFLVQSMRSDLKAMAMRRVKNTPAWVKNAIFNEKNSLNTRCNAPFAHFPNRFGFRQAAMAESKLVSNSIDFPIGSEL